MHGKTFVFLMNVQLLLARTLGCVAGGGKTKKTLQSPYLVCPPKQRQISVMVWGAITYGGQGTLKWVRVNINSQKYCSTLHEELLPLLQSGCPDNNYTFIQDNAPVHTSAETRAWLDHNSVSTSVWPRQSPGLNLIEKLRSSCEKISMGATHHQIYTSGLSVYFTPFLRIQSSTRTRPFHGG